MCTWWSQRGTVIVEISFDLGVHRELGVDVTWVEQVQSNFNLAEEAAPQAERELWVGGGKAGNGMNFVGVDGTF